MEIANYLHLSKRISLQEGERINVGERFTVRFTLTNTAPPPTTVEHRRVRFKRPYLQVAKTPYARPCMPPDGTPIDMVGNNFPANVIDPGESTSMEVEMLATANMLGITDLFLEEWIAEAYVSAHLDADEYFRVMRAYQIKTEISP